MSTSNPSGKYTTHRNSSEWLESESHQSPQESKLYQKRLKILHFLARDAYTCSETSALCTAFLGVLDELFQPNRCALILFAESEQSSVYSRHSRDYSKAVEEGLAPYSKSVLQEAIQTQMAVLSQDTVADGRFHIAASLHSEDVISVLCVPFGDEREIHGYLYLDRIRGAALLTQNDLDYLVVVCQLFEHAYNHMLALQKRSRDDERYQAYLDHIQSQRVIEYKIVGESECLRSEFEDLTLAAESSELPILLLGESGSGKELFARAVHDSSKRRERNLISVNLGAINEGTMMSELFGHVRGAFTGAVSDRKGLIAQAHLGTLFLDEVADIPLSMQSLLLRALDEKQVRRVGGNAMEQADVRLVAATHKDIRRMVREGSFRFDLYTRLAAITIVVPPLRERPDDIPALVQHFLKQFSSTKRFSEEALQAMVLHSWPGNIRQLKHTVEAASALTRGELIEAATVSGLLQKFGESLLDEPLPVVQPLKEAMANYEEKYIRAALRVAGGDTVKARELLDLPRATFSDKMRRFAIDVSPKSRT